MYLCPSASVSWSVASGSKSHVSCQQTFLRVLLESQHDVLVSSVGGGSFNIYGRIGSVCLLVSRLSWYQTGSRMVSEVFFKSASFYPPTASVHRHAHHTHTPDASKIVVCCFERIWLVVLRWKNNLPSNGVLVRTGKISTWISRCTFLILQVLLHQTIEVLYIASFYLLFLKLNFNFKIS